MSIAKAKDNLRSARRQLADVIDILPTKRFIFGNIKRGKVKRAIDAVDKSLRELRGL